MSGQGGQTTAPPPVNPPVGEFQKLSMVTPSPPLMVPLVPSAAKKLRTPVRERFGSVGKRVLIKANHFLVGL
uniref:Protein argonaute 1-like n=1 Tax=Tanacetum cinerariifolium TaxID=118510 RepID=A0A699KD89_TANCI|nr:protein argonaute 1-like [Tanacetum cinerariifolium]